MTEIPFSLIQVFDDPEQNFRGNIAAVMLLKTPLKEQEMQEIASDLNQPATTFLWRKDQKENTYQTRWFAPDGEIDLCGHGSLAAIAYLEKNSSEIVLEYKTGRISGKSNNGLCSITIKAIPLVAEVSIDQTLQEGLDIPVIEHYSTTNKNIVLVESEEKVRQMKPDFAKLRQSETFGYAVTAPGSTADFVSRTIIPHVRQLEDHATGSSHAALVPFWAKRLGKNRMTALQLSPRGGMFICDMQGEDVVLSGKHSIIARGTYFSP